MADAAPGDPTAALGMFASVLAGRGVAVAELPPGEPPWTDGHTIYVEACAPDRDGRPALTTLKAVAVQASLIAAGSLEPGIVRPLLRHPRLAKRYLAVEGHRALAASSGLLPGMLASLGDREIASRSDSPAASLRMARARAEIDQPAPEFGVIRAAKVWAAYS